ncbi:MAG: peptidoglycan-binding protein LysM [Pseudomonadaceae bacterium]|uniref:FimV/HubP family polar landmark protein n=1 Tax=Pseudomonas sp. Ga0074129 TaxID=1752219 RepID=UPI000AB27789|nr:FimV/HubP family polar landmark protein [Pseudomonas sp. Ga0074129]MBX9762040.1 peptidoglycan-binding protein LysM [Pseudomonadaceae bacterium]
MTIVRQLLIGLASSSALYSGLVPALGLGEISLNSALSQPLDAEIKLLDVGNLTDADVRVRLAPADVFSRSGVERLYFFNDLRFEPLLRGDSSVIRVLSTQPVREPYLNFIVEVARPSGRLYREYTVLLDPPGSASLVTAASPAAPAFVASARPVASERPRPTAMPAAQLGNRYSVVGGDSLWKIATRLAGNTGSSVTAAALVDHLYALNPQAFINGDVSRLRVGAQLLLPDRVAPLSTAGTGASANPAVFSVVQAEAVEAQAQPATAQAALDPAAELQRLEQARVERELASQIAETLQLQQSLAELGVQVQQLQQQMQARDEQIAGLLAELAARRTETDATPVAASSAAVSPAAAAAEPGNHWLAWITAMLALLLAGVAGLLWRVRNPGVPPVALAISQPEQPPAAALVAEALAQVGPATQAQASPAVPRTGPVWPAGDEDALQSANVYIAYGRLSEALDTLRKAWDAQPQRGDIGFRLLEVLALAGDAQGFLALEAPVRESGFSPVRIDELKARHADLLNQSNASLLDEVVLVLDESQVPQPPQPLNSAANDAQLNLDDLSLDADWDLVSPFAPEKRPSKTVVSETLPELDEPDFFQRSDNHNVRSPFAETMLVEETDHPDWSAGEFQVSLLDDLDALAGDHDNLSKLNLALAYIEQGSVESACQILNQVLVEGDEQQKQEALQLLAKIA